MWQASESAGLMAAHQVQPHATRAAMARRRLGAALITLVVFLQQQVSLASQPATDARPAGPATSAGAFCQPQTVGHHQAAGGRRVFCFYDIQDDFRPQELNPCLCTHVVYSYVAVRKNFSFIAGKKGDLRALASLKRKNPSLKLLVSLRPDDFFSFEPEAAAAAAVTSANGTAEQQPQQQQQAVAMNEMHQKFAKRVRDFIVRHSLDGINLDWPFFSQTLDSWAASRQHLTLTLQAISENFASSLGQTSPSAAYLRLLEAPLVTLTASKDFYSLLHGYDFHALTRLLDFVHLPAFDFDLNVDQYSIGHPARLHGIFDAENLDTLVDLVLSSGLPSHQLIAGIPAHGVQITSSQQPAASGNTNNFTTSTGSNGTAGATLDEQLEAAASISIVSHAEVCRVRQLSASQPGCSSAAPAQVNASQPQCWTVSRSRDLTAPFAYDAEHWIGFDDETSAKLKAKYALLRHLAGVALFTVNHDDPAASCGLGAFPLLAAINGVFARAAAGAPSARQAPAERGLFTRAPNQLLTATSLVSHILGARAKPAAGAHPQQPPAQQQQQQGDLIQSASEESASGLVSFVDIIEKYGAVQRLDGQPAAPADDPDAALACDKVGYQRYPRDCSRFYRCVQTPPLANNSASHLQQQQHALAGSITRLQYECPSGLVFDEQYQICNWPSWSAQCTGSGEVNSITNTKFVCPNYGYFQNQENCEYFYYCPDYSRSSPAPTQAYQFRCPFELGFDEEKLQCNWKWLVRGCNTTAAAGSSPSGANSSELAQKYLASLESSSTSTTSTTTTTTTTTTTSTTTTTTSTTERPAAMSRRSLELDEEHAAANDDEQDQASERGFTASLSSHVSSLLASVAAAREHRAKKAGRPGKPAGPEQADGVTKPARYPAFIGMPQTASAAVQTGQSATAAPNGFRLRRRHQTGEQATSAPYRRRPPPASVFSFLPSSAIYMLADSLRSVGEAASDELNRYMRLAGDRVRDLLGQRGGPASKPAGAKLKHRQSGRRADQQPGEALSRLAASFAGPAGSLKRLSVHNAGPINRGNNYHSLELDHGQRRLKRTRRDTGAALQPDADDLQALESAPQSREYVAAPPRPHQALAYQDPLGRPPGYPLNPLDEAAKRAVAGPEPKLYSQPTHLLLNQMSGISQAQYEQLVSRPAQQPRPRLATGYGQPADEEPLMSSASEQHQYIDHDKVIDRIIEHAREAFTLGGGAVGGGGGKQAAPVHFGMPVMVQRPPKEPLTGQESAQSTQLASSVPPASSSKQQKRRSTVAMKLATLALPKFGLASTTLSASPTSTSTSAPPTQASGQADQQQQQKTTGSARYKSFLPSFSDVVVTPARNIMNKALDFNRAVQGLIFTLAPGSGSNSQAAKQAASTPRMPQILPNEHSNRVNQLMLIQMQLQQQQQGGRQTSPMPMRNFHEQQNRQLALQQQRQAPQGDQFQMAESHASHSRVPLVNRTGGPLLLTESEAQALSAQLDQLSKEQLESLSADLFKGDQGGQSALVSQQQQQAQQQENTDQRLAQQQQQPTQSPTESPDYVVRLLKMLSQTSHNPEDIKLLDQLTGQLNNPRPNGQDQALIEIGQSDDLALLEALGMIPAQQHPQMQQQPFNEDRNHYTIVHEAQQNETLRENRPEAAFNGYPDTTNEMPTTMMQQQQQHPFARPGAMKPLIRNYQQLQQVQAEQPQLKLIDGMAPFELENNEHQGTTKFIPVALEVQHGLTTPMPYQQPVQQQHQEQRQEQQKQQQSEQSAGATEFGPVASEAQYEMSTPMSYSQPASVRYESHTSYPTQSAYSTYDYYPATPTTTSTSTSTTSTSTTTTTTTTTTTPQPTQLVTQIFQEQFAEKQVPPVRQTYTELIENNVTTPDGIETTLESRTKTAISSGAGFGISSQLGLGMVPRPFAGTMPVDSPMGEAQARQQQQQTPLNGTGDSVTTSASLSTLEVQTQSPELGATRGMMVFNANDATPSQQADLYSLNSWPDTSGAEYMSVLNEEQRQALLNSQQEQSSIQPSQSEQVAHFGQGGRTSSVSQTSQVLEQGAQQPLTSRLSSTHFSGPQAAGASVATLGGYNFATQPVSQMEEVVIKKKFTPFPKSVLVPQASTYKVDEVRTRTKSATLPPPVEQRQVTIAQREEVRGQQQSVSATDFDNIPSLAAQQEQLKDDELSSFASSLTQVELEKRQRVESDLKQIERQLQRHEAGQQRQQVDDASNAGLAEAMDPDAQLERSQASSAGSSAKSKAAAKAKSASKKQSRKSQTRRPTSSTTSAPTTTPTTSSEISTTRRSIEEAGAGTSGNRAEEAFSNFMVELKRSRKPESELGAKTRRAEKTKKVAEVREEEREKEAGTSTRKPEPPTSSGSSEQRQQRRKSRSKKLRHGQRLAGPAGSGRRGPTEGRKQPESGGQLVASEQVAIYGTKSGFMPIIKPDDPNYASSSALNTNRLEGQRRGDSNGDPLSFSSSFTSIKRQPLELQNTRRAPTDSWQSYFGRGKLADQVSVVHLGNYTEEPANRSGGGGSGGSPVEVKLVILPSSPNNQLLDARNWRHLASSYPALFPANLSELKVEPVSLGKGSIDLNGGLIDQQLEEARHNQFSAMYQEVSALIEPKTFKALDEMVQRSSGQLIMIQRRDTRDRTIIALIPDRPFIRSAMAPAGGYQRLVVVPTAAAAAAAAAMTTTPSKLISNSEPAKETTPQKAATFSRAIQESIQEAIRQRYDSMKHQVRQSLAAASDEEYNRQRSWLTPSADALAQVEAAGGSQAAASVAQGAPSAGLDPLDTASSSTEYSVAAPPPTTGRSYNSQALYEVDGAEAKTLYGLELINQAERQQFEQRVTSSTTPPPPPQPSQAQVGEPKRPKAHKSRFISVGSHLIASPMKKIVDQAYVNHFYDHISDHQLAKSIGFDEPLDERQPAAALANQTETGTSGGGGGEQQTTSEPAAMSADSLVPESACTRAGLFQHPFACNKFYECFWDKQLARFTLHMFECPIKLAFDERIVGCAMPIESSLCVNM